MKIRKIIENILFTLKSLTWFFSMIFRTLIVVIIINRIYELTGTANTFLGILGLSYVLYPLFDFLLELRKLQPEAIK